MAVAFETMAQASGDSGEMSGGSEAFFGCDLAMKEIAENERGVAQAGFALAGDEETSAGIIARMGPSVGEGEIGLAHAAEAVNGGDDASLVIGEFFAEEEEFVAAAGEFGVKS